MNLDDAFPSDLDEIIDRSLRPYRPVLTPLVATELHQHALTVVSASDNLEPWVSALRRASEAEGAVPTGAPPEQAGLTPAQRALLGGGAPGRVLDGLVEDLHLPLDGTTEEGAEGARELLLVAHCALRDLANLHRKAPEADPDAAQHLFEFCQAGAAHMMLAIVQELDDRGSGPAEAREVATYHHFIYLFSAHQRADLTEEDRRAYEEYTEIDLDALPAGLGSPRYIEDTPHWKVLKHFRESMVRGIAALLCETGPDPARVDPLKSAKLKAYIREEALRPRRKRS